VSQGSLVARLLDARFPFSQVATILDISAEEADRVRGSAAGTAAEGEMLSLSQFQHGMNQVVTLDVQEFERLGGELSLRLERAAHTRAELGRQLTQMLMDLSIATAADAAVRLRRTQALRHKTLRTPGWKPWWHSETLPSVKDKDFKASARLSSAATSTTPHAAHVDSWLRNSLGETYVAVYEKKQKLESIAHNDKLKRDRSFSLNPSTPSPSTATPTSLSSSAVVEGREDTGAVQGEGKMQEGGREGGGQKGGGGGRGGGGGGGGGCLKGRRGEK